ncbi:MAG: DUF481 domain-containing protein, partial [Bacteroidia bacterium]|nr:DUF481 domain-containing protein [Bacteroidia bacterium]
MKFIGTFFLICLISLKLYSQDSTQAKKPNPFFSKLKYKFVTDGMLLTGNVERFLYSTSLQLQYADSLIDFDLKPRFLYGEQTIKKDETSIRTVQEREPGLDFHFGLFSQKRFYGFAAGAIERSNLRNIMLRWVVGPGIGWHMVRRDNHKVNLTAATLREETDFIPENAIDYKIFRGSFRLKGKHSFIQNKLIISYLVNYLPSLAFDKNVRLTSNLSIEIPVSKKVQLRGSFDYIREGVIAPGVKND